MEPKNGECLESVNEGLRLISRKDGLKFGTDAYLLAAYIRARRGATAVELGSGTGILSLLCVQKEKAAHVYAIEVQPDFADLTARVDGLRRRATGCLAGKRGFCVFQSAVLACGRGQAERE